MEALIYLAKSTAILSLFFLVYELFLKKETYFHANRVFLLLGILVAAILPAFTYTTFIEIEPIVGELVKVPVVEKASVEVAEETGIIAFLKGLNYGTVYVFIYLAGVAFFFTKFTLSLVRLKTLVKNTGTAEYQNGIRYIRTTMITSPFAYFKTIVFNPEMLKEQEIESILKHEEAHVKNFHSVDIIVGHLVAYLNWFNPIAWFYRKRISENLEFLADMEATRDLTDIKEYQYALLNAATPLVNPILPVNSFQGSFIKRRILMMQKNRSSKLATIKLAIVLPILIGFFVGFQTESQAITVDSIIEHDSEKDSTYIKRIDDKTLLIRISPKTDLWTLEEIRKLLKNTYEIDFMYNKLEYNDNQQISFIELEIEDTGISSTSVVNYFKSEIDKNSNSIKPLTMQVTYSIIHGAEISESLTNEDGEVFTHEMILTYNVAATKKHSTKTTHRKNTLSDGNLHESIEKDRRSGNRDSNDSEPTSTEGVKDIILFFDSETERTDTIIVPQPIKKAVTDTILIKDTETGKTDTIIVQSEPVKKPVTDTILMKNPDTGKIDTIIIESAPKQ